MLFNAVSFLIIVICYAGMFLSIRASHSWNSNDTVVAKRMALLVFTDFFCWAPIIFFSLTAAFGFETTRISLNEAKVLTIFVLPLNSCANPFLYAFFTRQFKRDCVKLCKRIEESSISRHLSSSGMGRSSTAPRRQIHHVRHRLKRGSCDQIANEPSTSGEPSSCSNNASDDSDLNLRKLLLSPEEKQILRYVRSENTSIKPIRIINDDGVQTHCRGSVKLVPVRRLHTLSQPQEGAPDDDDIILHTSEGNVYLATKSKSLKGKRIKNSSNSVKCGGNGEKVTNTCAKRLCNHTVAPPSCSPQSPIVRTVESQTVELENINIEGAQGVEGNVRPMNDRKAVTKKFEAERSRQLGLKVNNFSNVNSNSNTKQQSSVTFKTTATQTDLNFQLPSAQIYNLQRAIAKQEKDKHINEWRKTSHLSFLLRNSGNFDAVAQKQKSNSLVELTRPVTNMQNTSTKRHSLTSKHEGYILLKNTSRDSAYEDDEMYEFYEPRVTPKERKPKKKSSVEYKNAVYDDGFRDQLLTKADNEMTKESEDVCDTSILLPDSLCLPMNRNSCDNESGISSSS